MGVEPHPSEFMRLGRAPAHPRVPGPGIEPGGRPYESRLGACHARGIDPILSRSRGEIRTQAPNEGHKPLRLTCLPFGHQARSPRPCGDRTRLSGMRGRCACRSTNGPSFGVRRAGVEPAMPGGGWVTATWARQCPAALSHEVSPIAVSFCRNSSGVSLRNSQKLKSGKLKPSRPYGV